MSERDTVTTQGARASQAPSSDDGGDRGSRDVGDGPGRPHRAHYAPGVPDTIEAVSEPLWCMLRDATRQFPDRVAMDFMGAATTYAQMSHQVSQAAQALRRLGVGPGDVVGVVLPNCPQHAVLAYAAWRLGAVVAEHNPLAPAAQLREQIRIHHGRVLIAWEKTLERLVQAVGSLEDAGLGGLSVYSVDLSRGLPLRSRLALRLPLAAARARRRELRGTVPEEVGSWDELVSSTSSLPEDHPQPRVDDTAALLYTGGTTGKPKAVRLTHANLRSNAQMSLAWACQTTAPGQETFYAVLPFFHAFGLSLSLLCAVGLAATQVVLPKFSADMVLAAWRRRPATFFPGVPVMFDRLATRAAQTGADLSSCRTAVCGAAPNPRAVAQAWEKATGGVIIEGYGMTESSPIVLGNPISPERRPGTLGVPYPSTEARLVDPQNIPDHLEREVAPGEVGELLVRGPQVFTGYWEDPQETAEVLLEGGWLRTGDLVRQEEEDGFYVIADRRKELIISGGFNVYPSQVEEAVRSMPQVEDVAVVGLPAESGNESVVAAIQPREGQSVSLEQVREWAATTLSHYALPRQIAILPELPRSQIGKVLRRVVREQLLAAREAAAAGASGAASTAAASVIEVMERLPGGGSQAGGRQRDGQDQARAAGDTAPQGDRPGSGPGRD